MKYKINTIIDAINALSQLNKNKDKLKYLGLQ